MRFSWLPAALAASLLASCSTLARPFTGPDADLSFTGGALIPDDDLPRAEGVVPNGLRISITSELINDETRARLLEVLKAKAGTRYASMRGETDPPQFELIITEMSENNDFDTNTIGAVAGAVIGGGTGVAVDRNSRVRGGVVGAAAGAAAGAFFFGEQQNAWAFEVLFKQRTSAEGAKQINTRSESGTSSGGSLAGTTGVVSGGDALQERTSQTSFDVTSNTAVSTRYFAVSSVGGVFSSEDGRKDAAREEIIKKLGDYLMGGGDIGF